MAKVSPKLAEKIQARKAALKSGGTLEYFIISEEGIRVRIMPPKGADDEFCINVVVFFNPTTKRSIISPVSLEKRCAMMELYKRLKDSDDSEERELATSIAPKKRIVLPCLKYRDKLGKEVDKNAGIKLLLAPGGLYSDIIDLYLDEEHGDFTDPKEGYDLKFSKSGKGLNTEYKVMPCKPTKLEKEFSKEKADVIEMLEKILPSFEETKAFAKDMMGALESSGDDDEDDTPKKKKKAPSKGTDLDQPKKKKKKA